MCIFYALLISVFFTSILMFGETHNLLWAGVGIISLAFLLAVGQSMDNKKLVK